MLKIIMTAVLLCVTTAAYAVPIKINVKGHVTYAFYDPRFYDPRSHQLPEFHVGDSFTGIISYDFEKINPGGRTRDLYQFNFGSVIISDGNGSIYGDLNNNRLIFDYASSFSNVGEIDLCFGLVSGNIGSSIIDIDPVKYCPVTFDPGIFSNGSGWLYFDDAWFARYHCTFDSIEPSSPSPVPEPSTMALMGVGVACLAYSISLRSYARERKQPSGA
jgi:hypothetical protein